MIPFAPTDRPIGLDLGAYAIRAVQTDRAGAVAARATIPRPDPAAPHDAEEFRRLRGVLFRQGFRGDRAFVAAPKQTMSRTTLDLPPRGSGAPIDVIARGEIARQTKTDPASFEFVWWDAPQPPRHGDSIRAITLCCPHEAAHAIIGAVEHAGLRVEGLFTPSTAAAASLPPPPPGRVNAVIDLGWTDATLIVINHQSIVFERHLTGCGLAEFVRRAAAPRGIPPAELARAIARPAPGTAAGDVFRDVLDRYTSDVAAEVRSSVDYLRGCGGCPAPTELTLIGGGASVPGLDSAIAEHAGLPAVRHALTEGPAHAAAVGLASIDRSCTVTEAA